MTGVVVGVSPGLGRSAGRYIPQAFGADSLLEGTGFELPVPRAMQGRPKAIIDGFGCMPPSLDSAAAVGGDQRRRAKAKSRNRSLIARGTGSSNPPPSTGKSVANLGVPSLPTVSETPSTPKMRCVAYLSPTATAFL